MRSRRLGHPNIAGMNKEKPPKLIWWLFCCVERYSPSYSIEEGLNEYYRLILKSTYHKGLFIIKWEMYV
ncbi:hypothetical protein GCM10007366_22110 [Mammaliicoccus vitulinus]|nr:hypothetical protein GCM10007366_22110 [Mammaliicoccus vitulinus]